MAESNLSPSNQLADAHSRELSLDTNQSFIVQAPAGSGKTELLTQRLLSLLSVSKEPETILAITFTKKAAGEMRSRLSQSLLLAKQFLDTHQDKHQQNIAMQALPEHEQKNLTLALRCLDSDKKNGWNLIKNPNRLQIKTIDSFCSQITFQQPILSKLGSQANISEDSEVLYKQASHHFLTNIEKSDANKNDNDSLPLTLRRAMLHLDNNFNRIERLLSNMLSKREQWLPVIMKAHLDVNSKNERDAILKQHFEAAIEEIIEDSLCDAFNDKTHKDPLNLILENLPLLQFCAGNLDEDSPLYILKDIRRLPKNKVSDLKIWNAISELLLTRSDQWRKKVTKTEGFPAASAGETTEEKALFKSNKSEIIQLIANLALYPNFRESLLFIRKLPQPSVEDSELSITSDLVTLLPILVAYLQIEFQQNNAIDFSEVSLRAINALNADTFSNPLDTEMLSETSLRLDQQVHHILIDEFQDTSNTQQHLLESLVAEWSNEAGFAEDGKTLFLVGDPMQSIYRFREANVGLFLNAQKKGVRDVDLVPLKLQTNFRSQSEIVHWINHIFSKSFPLNSNPKTGAVNYTPSISFNDGDTGNCRCLLTVAKEPEKSDPGFKERLDESETICEEIIDICSKPENADDSIAILLRSKNLANGIIRNLKTNNIAYEAIDIDRLNQRSHILDLITLSSSILNLNDDISWMALLRSPLCGLNERDLLEIRSDDSSSVFSAIRDKVYSNALSQDGQAIIQRTFPILAQAVSHREFKSHSYLTESLWLSLGGPDTISEGDLQDCKSYFDLLRRLDQQSEPISSGLIERKCESLFSNNSLSTSSGKIKKAERTHKHVIKIMTIHKSKGLEFDHVFLPGLDRGSRHDDKALLQWDIFTSSNGLDFLLLSTLAKSGNAENTLYTYLQYLEKTKANNERIRLLYVATTRAKKQLFLLANVVEGDDSDKLFKTYCNPLKKPDSTSLLSLIWQHLENETEIKTIRLSPKNQNKINTKNDIANSTREYTLHRLPPKWQHPIFDETFQAPEQQQVSEINTLNIPKNIFREKEPSAIIGTIAHRYFKHIATSPADKLTPIIEFENIWKMHLNQAGIYNNTELNHCLTELRHLSNFVLDDKENYWIFDRDLEQAESEYAISTHIDGKPSIRIIDRTFIHEGKRWIIDYKTSAPKPEQSESQFIAEQKVAHKSQLDDYARCFANMENIPQQKAIYFPRLKYLDLL